MDENFFDSESMSWQAVLDALSQIRESDDYSRPNVELVRESLRSEDDRIRAAAALAAEGCLFEAHILDVIIEIAEYDSVPAIRKAAIQTLGEVIREGVAQEFEDDTGADTALDYAEEWDEYQSGGLREEYQRVKQLLFGLLDFETDPEILAKAVFSLSDLGYIADVRDKIAELYDNDTLNARGIALQAMGKFPRYWESEIAAAISPDTPDGVLKDAISAGYASQSRAVSDAVEGVLDHEDPQVLHYALLTLANINQSPNLTDIFQNFSQHPDSTVQAAAREGLDIISRLNLGDYLQNDLGFSV